MKKRCVCSPQGTELNPPPPSPQVTNLSVASSYHFQHEQLGGRCRAAVNRGFPPPQGAESSGRRPSSALSSQEIERVLPTSFCLFDSHPQENVEFQDFQMRNQNDNFSKDSDN